MAKDYFEMNVQLHVLQNGTPLVDEAKSLLKEYGQYMYEELGLIAGKETFFKELEEFPTNNYLTPTGIFFIAKTGDTVVGCGGIKKLSTDSCEIKRLFVRNSFRGKGIGKLLCDSLFEWGRKNGYRRMLLDTNIEMKEAVLLYRKYGFKEIQPYCINENTHPVFMECILQ